MYLEIFLADFVVFRVFLGISRDFAEIPEFRRSATARIIRSPVLVYPIVKHFPWLERNRNYKLTTKQKDKGNFDRRKEEKKSATFDPLTVPLFSEFLSCQ